MKLIETPVEHVVPADGDKPRSYRLVVVPSGRAIVDHATNASHEGPCLVVGCNAAIVVCEDAAGAVTACAALDAPEEFTTAVREHFGIVEQEEVEDDDPDEDEDSDSDDEEVEDDDDDSGGF